MMKKNLFLILFALICSFPVFSQISWNVKAGFNMSNWSKGSSDTKFDFLCGIGIEYAFDQTWALQPSLLISSKGKKQSLSTGTMTVNQVYAELPVMAAARLRVSDNVNIVLSAGPYFAYGIGGKTSWSNIYNDENTFENDGLSDVMDLDKFDAGIGSGVALEINKFIISIGGEWGLTNLGSINYSPKNENYTLSVGYKF